MGEVIVFTSGKGGVGKTTAVANVGIGLSLLEKRILTIDLDIGLRNLDVVLGIEQRIQYHLLDVLEQKFALHQAIIRYKNAPNLYLLPAPCNMLQLSRYKDQWCRLIAYLRNQYDYILLDCPAGIGPGFDFATSLVDEAILVTTGGIASLHDARKVKDILDYRGICCEHMIMHEETKRHLFESRRMGIAPMEELLEVTLLGKIPYDENIPISQNIGIPYLNLKRKTKEAFIDIAKKIYQKGAVSYELPAVESYARS